jgi:hypothetical protein
LSAFAGFATASGENSPVEKRKGKDGRWRTTKPKYNDFLDHFVAHIGIGRCGEQIERRHTTAAALMRGALNGTPAPHLTEANAITISRSLWGHTERR